MNTDEELLTCALEAMKLDPGIVLARVISNEHINENGILYVNQEAPFLEMDRGTGVIPAPMYFDYAMSCVSIEHYREILAHPGEDTWELGEILFDQIDKPLMCASPDEMHETVSAYPWLVRPWVQQEPALWGYECVGSGRIWAVPGEKNQLVHDELLRAVNLKLIYTREPDMKREEK